MQQIFHLNTNFIKACYGEAVNQMPVWFMRQAGRYQPEYRAIRKENTLMEIVFQPDLCAHVTKLPVEQLGVDAAILFSDIMTPVKALGIDFEIKPGFGPYVEKPVRSIEQITALKSPDFSKEVAYVGTTIELLRQQLKVPLIGFCGAPYTLAYYLVEGGKSKSWQHLHGMMYANDGRWQQLMQHLAVSMSAYLKYQVAKGAQAVQLFDSWAGDLSFEDYEQFVFPYVQHIFEELKSVEVPKIYFGLKTSHLFPLLQQYACEVIGIDHTISITKAYKALGETKALQGNLAPTALFADRSILDKKIDSILEAQKRLNKPSFIFNLGHGCLPEMKSENLKYVVDYVHEKTKV